MRRFYPFLLVGLTVLLAMSLRISAQQNFSDEAALEDSLSRSDEGLQEKVMADGAVQIDLEGRFQSASVVRILPDGTLEQRCVTHEEGMRIFLNQRDIHETRNEEVR